MWLAGLVFFRLFGKMLHVTHTYSAPNIPLPPRDRTTKEETWKTEHFISFRTTGEPRFFVIPRTRKRPIKWPTLVFRLLNDMYVWLMRSKTFNCQFCSYFKSLKRVLQEKLHAVNRTFGRHCTLYGLCDWLQFVRSNIDKSGEQSMGAAILPAAITAVLRTVTCLCPLLVFNIKNQMAGALKYKIKNACKCNRWHPPCV